MYRDKSVRLSFIGASDVLHHIVCVKELKYGMTVHVLCLCIAVMLKADTHSRACDKYRKLTKTTENNQNYRKLTEINRNQLKILEEIINRTVLASDRRSEIN